MLTEEGYVSPRPGIGCVVAKRGSRFWKGHVVFVVKNFAGSYYTSVIADVLNRSLSEKQYLFSQVVVSAGDKWRPDNPGTYDFSSLEMALSQPVDLVVIMADSQRIATFVAKRGIPFLVIGEQEYDQASFSGLIRFDRGGAIGVFVDHCQRTGVKSVLQVGVESGAADAVPALRDAGICAERLWVPVDWRYRWLEGAQRSAMTCLRKRLADPSKRPGLIFFNDDFVANGGLQAIDALGIRMPDDLKVVSWANLGVGPVYRLSLTRMEMNSYEHGQTIAAYVLEYLKNGRLSSDARIGPVYRKGESF